MAAAHKHRPGPLKRALSITAAVLVLAPALALGWLMTTESGLRFAYRSALPWLPGEFTATRVAGYWQARSSWKGSPIGKLPPAWKRGVSKSTGIPGR